MARKTSKITICLTDKPSVAITYAVKVHKYDNFEVVERASIKNMNREDVEELTNALTAVIRYGLNLDQVLSDHINFVVQGVK